MQDSEQGQLREEPHEATPSTPSQRRATEESGHHTPAALSSPMLPERDYGEVLRVMQQGHWERAVPMLRALQAQHPAASELAELMQEATFRASMEQQWAEQVQGRQGFTLPIRALTSALLVLVMGALLTGGLIYYGRLQRVNAQIDQEATLLQQAQAALAAAQHREALDLFEQLLAANPTSPEARKGQSETLHQMRLATDYQIALDHIAAGNYQQALVLLTDLQSVAPGYRDVDKRLAEAKSHMGVPQFFADAELAFSNGLWVTAIAQYEQLRRLDSTYEAVVTQEHLAAAYRQAGQQIVAIRPSDSMAPEQAEDYFQKAQQLNPKDAAVKTEIALLQAYLTGERLVTQVSYEPAIQALFPVYEARPTYFGGYVAELLYRAYVSIAESYVVDQELESALLVYQRAEQLGLDSGHLLEQRITAIALLLTPAPTPTVTPPPVVFEPAPPPVSTATPPADWRTQYRGWIVFYSTRTGSEALFIMRADGSEVQPAPADVVANLTQLYQAQQMTSDGAQRLYVKQAADQSSANIFKGAAVSDSDERMLTSYGGTEYDPVWSPDGQWIAFVANHTGNDEIWRMDGNGGQPGQLTFNEWQWDKHPSFSPDGQQIVFYSNRTGQRQVWRMAADGANQQNLSNNSFDEWDPVWLR